MKNPEHLPPARPINLIFTGALLCLLSVALGAFGAHLLKGVIEEARLGTWETAVRYQFFHSIGILIAGIWYHISHRGKAVIAGYWFLLGLVLFSGSLYALVLTDIRWLGAVTPIGGVSFMIGWGYLAWSGKR